MTPAALYAAIHAEPFRPFRLMLADGRTLHIPHPEWILHPPGARTAIVMNADESYRVLDVDLVLELEHGPPVPAGAIAPDPDGGE